MKYLFMYIFIIVFASIVLYIIGRFARFIDDKYINHLCECWCKWLCVPCIFGYYARYNTDCLKEHGIICFLGEQGQGKTISMTRYLLNLCKKYPKAIVQENYIKGNLSSWRDLLKFKNGRYGIITAIDECGLWLNSKNSKDVDVSLLQIVAQNRKDRRVILCTSQAYYMLSKDFRTQIRYYVKCRCFLGFITYNKWFKPVVDEQGNLIKEIPIKFDLFLQSPWLRSQYDTLKTITALSKDGFIRKDLLYDNTFDNNTL